LVKHPSIQAVGFTGSLKGGNALSRMAAERAQPIPVFAEMSSINPVILLPEALQARTMGCGQFCTNPGLIIGMRSAAFTDCIEVFKDQMAEQPAQTMLNQGTLASYSHGLEQLYNHLGVTHLAGAVQGERQAQPQLFKADVSLLLGGDPLLQEEVFGAVTVIIEVENQAQLGAAVHALRGQLTATLFAQAEELAGYGWLSELLQEKVGRVLLNGSPTGVEDRGTRA
jgi:NADP-dependent aldehyde dehydrogenase